MLLHSSVYGTGAPHNIWLHGFLGHGGNFASIVKRITGTHYLLDLPNHGNSYHAKYAKPYENVSNDVIKFAQLQEGQKFNLIGHSLGGRIAMHAAYLRPDMINKVVVLDIAPIDSTDTYKHIFTSWKHMLTQLSYLNLQGKTKEEILQAFDGI